eukprot:4658534-Karenia_brevis.AAC.1
MAHGISIIHTLSVTGTARWLLGHSLHALESNWDATPVFAIVSKRIKNLCKATMHKAKGQGGP